MPRLRNRNLLKRKKCYDVDVDEEDDIHIKSEVVDEEETVEILPDVTVEKHESVDELRKVLKLPETHVQSAPLLIKSEESLATTSSQTLSLSFPAATQSTSNVLPQYYIPTTQSSYQIQITGAENTIIGIPAVPDGESGKLSQHNTSGAEMQKNVANNFLNNKTILQKDVERSCASKKPKKSHVYHQQTTLLQTVYQQRETFGNMDTEVIKTEPSEIPTEKRKDPAIVAGACSSMPNKWKLDAFGKVILDILKANVKLQPKELIQDPDEMFLRSQLPHIRNIEPCDKLQFQIQFMELLQKFICTDPDSF